MIVYPVQAERWHIGGAAVDGERLSTTEAVTRLCWRLVHGEAMTTTQAATLIGYPYNATYKMLCRMSRYVPMCQDDDGLWSVDFGQVV